MADYRVYMLDAGGRIFHGVDIEAAHDAGAISVGRIMFGEQFGLAKGFEIWDGTNLIFREFG
jgi:hypothetical protein